MKTFFKCIIYVFFVEKRIQALVHHNKNNISK